MKPVLYTCITDNRDPIPPLPYVNDRLDYVIYLDPAMIHAGVDQHPWQVRPLAWQHPTDPVRTARWHKHHPMECFPHRDSSIWMDATHWPVTDISWFPSWFLRAEAPIACFPHFARSGVVPEAEAVIRVRTDDEATVRAQIERYRAAGFVSDDTLRITDLRLYDTCIVVRRHGEPVEKLSALWWDEIERGSRRDQLSFTYCLWRLGMHCAKIEPGYSRHQSRGDLPGSPYFGCRHHRPKEWKP